MIDHNRVKAIYKATKLTPSKFARLLRVSRRTVTYWLWEDTTRTPSPLAQVQLKRLENRLIREGTLERDDK